MSASRKKIKEVKAEKLAKNSRAKLSLSKKIAGHFRNHQQVAVDSLDRLFVAAGSSFLTWAMIAIAVALPLFLFLLLQNLEQFGSDVDETAQISLFMEIEISQQELDEIENKLQMDSRLLFTEVIAPEDALKEFEQSSGFGDVLSGLDENPLPPVIIVIPELQDLSVVRALVSEFEALAGVDYVQFDLDWLQKLYSILSLAQRLTFMLGMLLAIGVALVVGNTVRLAIENRRDEIVVVKLVGGTDSYVARPFLYTGLWYGIGGGFLASALVLVAQFILQGPVSRLAGLYDGEFSLVGLSLNEIFMVLLACGFLGWFGACLSVLRHLRAIEPR